MKQGRQRRVISLGRCGYKIVRDGSAVRLEGPLGLLSYYHPKRPFTGLAWDSHTAATFLVPADIRSVLLLGLGGGTIARQIRIVAPKARIVGVEIENEVIEGARHHFQLRDPRLTIKNASSLSYLRSCRTCFDIILDDVWPPEDYERRPVRAERGWASLVYSRLAPGGLYAVTAFRGSEDAADIPSILDRMGKILGSACEVRPRHGETTVLAFSENLSTSRTAHRRRRRAPRPVPAGLAHITYHRC